VIGGRTSGNENHPSARNRQINLGNVFRSADIPSGLMILMAIRKRFPRGTGLAPTIGVGVWLLLLHFRTAE
jgi:hypothetical protein